MQLTVGKITDSANSFNEKQFSGTRNLFVPTSPFASIVPFSEYVAEWDQEDDPAVEHRNLFPHCPLMRGDNCGNVTLEDEEAEEELGEEGDEERRRRRWEDRAAREDR